MATCMPPRGHRTAPTFNPSKPREIKRFFLELQYHFDTAEITDNTEKKNHATRYVDCDIADIWKSLPFVFGCLKALRRIQGRRF